MSNGKLETKTKIIDGLEVSVLQFDCWTQADLLEKLGKVAAPALSTLEGSTTLTADNVGPFLAEIFKNLDTRERHQLQLDILAGTGVTVGSPPRFIELNSKARIAEVCGANLLLFGSILAFSLEANVGGFFGELMSRARSLMKAAPSKSTPAG